MTNLHIIDLLFQGVPESIASYLLVGPEGPVLIETGPGSCLPALKAGLSDHGFEPADVKHVLVTHIHLDHAGAAGWWAQQGAQIYVHEFGARHLIDPSKLIASATRIYGDKMDVLWGEILPAPEERVTAVYDNDTIHAGGLTFTALDTPGHARHHHTYKLGDIAFTGDVTGIQKPGFPLIDLPTPPPEFDIEAWEASIDKLRSKSLDKVYPTHFGEVSDVADYLDRLKPLIGETANFVREKMEAGMDRDAIVAAYTKWNRNRAREAGASEEIIEQYETTNPLYMSVDGIMRYWRKREG